MKVIWFSVVMFLSAYSYAKESCDLESLKLTSESALAERLFYVGTCHYRNEEYEKSVGLWKQLAELKNIEPKYSELQVDSLNNLGYMLFFGYGIQENKAEAMRYWNDAINLGHTEAEFHLCHAYGDSKVSTYNPVKAIAHCKKAQLVYRGMKDKSSGEKENLKIINNYLKDLNVKK